MRNFKIIDYNQLLKNILEIPEEKIEDYISKRNKDKYYKHSFEIEKKNGKRKIYYVDSSNHLYNFQKN